VKGTTAITGSTTPAASLAWKSLPCWDLQAFASGAKSSHPDSKGVRFGTPFPFVVFMPNWSVWAHQLVDGLAVEKGADIG